MDKKVASAFPITCALEDKKMELERAQWELRDKMRQNNPMFQFRCIANDLKAVKEAHRRLAHLDGVGPALNYAESALKARLHDLIELI